MTVFPLLKSALELTSVIGRADEYPGFGLCQIYLQVWNFFQKNYFTKIMHHLFHYTLCLKAKDFWVNIETTILNCKNTNQLRHLDFIKN